MSELPVAIATSKKAIVKQPFSSEQRFYLWLCSIIVTGTVTGVLGGIYLLTHK